MTDTITVRQLFDSLHARLALKWLGGEHGGNRTISRDEAEQSGSTLIGHLNFIHPNRIQVLGVPELQYLHGLGKPSCDNALQKLFSPITTAVLIADGQPVPGEFITLADAHEIPVLATPLDGSGLITELHYFLSHRLAGKTTLHGVFMEVMGIGVLLSGASNIGKSELALELITRGHRLVADDAPEFSRVAPDIVSGSCPEVLREFLEVRGLGVINVRAMFGDSAIKQRKYLRLIIRLDNMTDQQLREIDRLQGTRRVHRLLGVDVPELTLPVAPGRNLAVLVETAVRNHALRLKGYEAHLDFIKRQQQFMHQGES